MIRIVRQGIGSAVVQVDVDGLEAKDVEGQKASAKSSAAATMFIMGWRGHIVATRATLDAEGKFYSVTVRNYKS
jgi:hypothetical protein